MWPSSDTEKADWTIASEAHVVHCQVGAPVWAGKQEPSREAILLTLLLPGENHGEQHRSTPSAQLCLKVGFATPSAQFP